MKEYAIVKCEAWMNGTGYGFTYERYPGSFPRVRDARTSGMSLFGHDDFNIVELIDGKLARLLWMGMDLKASTDELTEIAEAIGVEVAP